MFLTGGGTILKIPRWIMNSIQTSKLILRLTQDLLLNLHILQQKLSDMIKSLFAFLHLRFISDLNIKLVWALFCIKKLVVCLYVVLGTIISISANKAGFYNSIVYGRITSKDAKSNVQINNYNLLED